MKYRMGLILLKLGISFSILAQHAEGVTSFTIRTDSLSVQPQRPWRAVVENLGLNASIWAFDRFVINADYARVSLNSIKHNFKHGPVWDLDHFSTNLFAHPYHGSLYYNAARSNGLNFWQSIPYVVGGSALWEMFGECEMPSINDLIATSMGGIALGEINFRLSDIVLDERTFGSERVWREVLGGVISPIRFLNRLIDGRVGKVKPLSGKELPSAPIAFVVNAGVSTISERYTPGKATVPQIVLGLNYGNPFVLEETKPYEWFQLRLGVQAMANQPLIGNLNTIGVIWSKNVLNKNDYYLNWGVYQHFDYYNSGAIQEREDRIPPYRIFSSGVGLGLLAASPSFQKVQFFAEAFVNAVPLGASVSDHFDFENRDYNMGSGTNSELTFSLDVDHKWLFSLSAEHYLLYTWKGYEMDLAPSEIEQGIFNAQGDEGSAQLLIFGGQVMYAPHKQWNLSLSTRNFIRHTNYKYFPDANSRTLRVSIGAGYYLFSD